MHKTGTVVPAMVRGLILQADGIEIRAASLAAKLSSNFLGSPHWAILVYGPNETRGLRGPSDSRPWTTLWGPEGEWTHAYMLLMDATDMAAILRQAAFAMPNLGDPLQQLAHYFKEGPRIAVFAHFNPSQLYKLLEEKALLETATDD